MDEAVPNASHFPPPPPVAAPLLLGSPGRRIVGGLLDVVPLVLLFIGLSSGQEEVITTTSGVTTSTRYSVSGLPFVAWLALIVLLPVVLEAITGTTFGKSVVGLRVASIDGTPVTRSQLAKRNLMRLVDALPLFYVTAAVAVWASKNRQRLGDMIAETIVVKGPKPSGAHRLLLASTALAISVGGLGLLLTSEPPEELFSGDEIEQMRIFSEDLVVETVTSLDPEALEAALDPRAFIEGDGDRLITFVQSFGAFIRVEERPEFIGSELVDAPWGERIETARFQMILAMEENEVLVSTTTSISDGKPRLLFVNFQAISR